MGQHSAQFCCVSRICDGDWDDLGQNSAVRGTAPRTSPDSARGLSHAAIGGGCRVEVAPLRRERPMWRAWGNAQRSAAPIRTASPGLESPSGSKPRSPGRDPSSLQSSAACISLASASANQLTSAVPSNPGTLERQMVGQQRQRPRERPTTRGAQSQAATGHPEQAGTSLRPSWCPSS
jgi:hypothetical protein